MQLGIDPSGHLPVHVQLKEQLKVLILNGDLKPGNMLPTTRQLAGFLRINRNTVSRAYQELAREGLIECRQGRGCEVVERPAEATTPASTQALALIDDAIEQTRQLGIGLDEFANLAYARAQQLRATSTTTHLVFVECEGSVAADYARAIEEKMDVKVVPLVLQGLEQPTALAKEQLEAATLVATTFFHVEEVERLLQGYSKQVVGLTVKTPLEALIQVARIPEGTPVVMVCVDRRSAELMKRSLEDAGIEGLDASVCGMDESERLREILGTVSVVIASDHVSEVLRPLVRADQKMVVLNYVAVDEGAIKLLKAVM